MHDSLTLLPSPSLSPANLRVLKVALWNANGVRKRKNILERFLEEEKIDICLLSETRLRRESTFEIGGYNTYHSPYPAENRARGGSGILIRKDIDHTLKCRISDRRYQLTVVTIESLGINVGAVYCPPRNNLKQRDYTKLLFEAGEKFLIGGDFNAKHTYWGSRLINTKGKELKKAIDKQGCDVASTRRTTHKPPAGRQPDLLDFFIHNAGVNYNRIQDSDHSIQDSSDHKMITLEISREW